MYMRKTKAFLFVVSFLLYAESAHAVQISDKIMLNGFGTIGATKTSSDSLGYRSSLETDNAVYDDWNFASRSLVGVQSNFRFTPEWASTIQLIQQHTTEASFDDAIQLAMITYTPNADWALQVGRFLPKVSMLTDNQNIGYGHLWTHSPVESYGQFLISTADGAEISYTQLIDDDTLKHIFTVVHAPSTYVTEQQTVDISGLLFGYTAEYSHADWLFRASIFSDKNRNAWVNQSLMNGLSQASPYWPEAATLYDEMDVQGSHAYLYSLGASYNTSDWQIQSEISQLKTDKQVMLDCISGYLSVGRHIGDFTPYVMYSQVHTTRDPYQLQSDPGVFNTLATPALAYLGTQYEQKTMALGVRWDINANLALKTQWERAFVDKRNNVLWWNNYTGKDQDVNIFTIDLDFTF